MREQLLDVAVLVGRQPREHVFEVGVGIVSVELGRLNETGDRSSALARQQGSGEEPVFSTCGPGSDLLLVVVVIDRQRRIVQVTHQRRPALKAVVDGLGGRAAVHDLGALGHQPGMQCHRDRPCTPLSFVQALLGRHVFHLSLYAVELTDEVDRRGGDSALVGLHEFDEVPARVRHATRLGHPARPQRRLSSKLSPEVG